jgi:Kelch motif/Galactose oxidase, central domain
MTDHELEQRLRSWYRAQVGEAERAPAALRASVAGIPPRRSTLQRRMPWAFPVKAPIRFAAAAVIAVLALGGAFYALGPQVPAGNGPSQTPIGSPRPGEPSVSPSSPGEPSVSPSSGTMMAGRGLHTATLLADGRVLIIGGYATGHVALASAEIYDPGTDTFSPTGSLVSPRGQHTATLIADGRVLIVGGFVGSSSLATAEIYDPGTGTFAATGSMSAGRGFHEATLLADGRVLVTGGDHELGRPVATAEIYDPGTGRFGPTGEMAVARTLHTATLLSDGRVLIAGGGSEADGICFRSAEIYDPGTGAFSATGTMTTNRCGHDASLISDGRVLLTGGAKNWSGSAGQASAELFDPATGSFSLTGSLVDAPADQTGTRLEDGRVLIAGGAEDLLHSLSSAELYDPVTGVFSLTGSMATPRMFHTATRLADGRVLITGGDSRSWTLSGPFLSSAEIYAPATGTFSPAGEGPPG